MANDYIAPRDYIAEMQAEPHFKTAQEIAEILGITKRAVYHYIQGRNQPKLPIRKLAFEWLERHKPKEESAKGKK